MKLDSKKVFYAAIALLALLASLMMLGFFQGFQKVLVNPESLSMANPLGVMAVFAVFIFAGIYFFNVAGKIMKEALK